MTRDRLDRAVTAIPRAYPGPGGALAVLKDGEVLVRHAWGYANAERRIPFTPNTLFRMCSITKQFTCGLVLDAFPDPTVLDEDVQARLPKLEQAAPDTLHLCHNQSGLRDYWAVAMLQGSPVEAPFGDAEADRLIASTRTLHFTPGTRFSYVNQNFRILSDIVRDRTGRGFGELLRDRIFDRAGMASAFLAADTSAMPDGTQGYEGNITTGFRAAENRILWTGDAGLGASLNDMIAWERFIDAGREDPHGLYNRLSAPVRFADGAPAGYGFGLGRRYHWGRPATGHGGALRGWRSHRVYLPNERISVVVLFNHFGDAQAAATDLLAAVLEEAPPPSDPAAATVAPPPWLGAYREPETGLAVRIAMASDSQVRLRFGHNAETLDLQADGSAGSGGTCLSVEDGALWMHRPQENQSTCLQPLQGEPAGGIAGRYRCDELGAELTVTEDSHVPYAAFSGPLGLGRMEMLQPIGPDVWALPCPRGLDHTPPGDWTLVFSRSPAGSFGRSPAGSFGRSPAGSIGRSPAGKVVSVQVGCWLARGLSYAAIGS